MPATVIATSAAALTCDDVSVRAGRREVVSRFTWQHSAGGIAWLFGSNGSGKSSLLRVLAGFQRAASGQVRWTGNSQKVRFLTPAMSAPPELRVCDFIELVQSLARGTDSEELDSLLPKLADDTHRFRKLSTGEAKRLLLWSILRQHSQFESGDVTPPRSRSSRSPTSPSSARRPLILDEPYEHLSRDAKAVLTVLLQRWAKHSIVVIATNQDVPTRSQDTLLTLEGTRLEVGSVS
jgi:ABC-type transport system involved in cytochrome c biogenesis ATPase subunit